MDVTISPPIFQLQCNVPDIELRGLLKLVVHQISVTRCHDLRSYDGLHCFEVVVVVVVPDRDDPAHWVSVHFGDRYLAQRHHIAMGMSQEQSALAQQLEKLWHHELGEGFVANGVAVWDPEPAHNGNR